MKKSKIILGWTITCALIATLLLGYIGRGYAIDCFDDYIFTGGLFVAFLLYMGAILLYEKYQWLRFNSDEYIEME